MSPFCGSVAAQIAYALHNSLSQVRSSSKGRKQLEQLPNTGKPDNSLISPANPFVGENRWKSNIWWLLCTTNYLPELVPL